MKGRLAWRWLGTALMTAALLAGGCGDRGPEREEPRTGPLTVYVAASLADVMAEVGDVLAADHGVRLECNFAGSGTLARQLIAAPRADVFVSANDRWMDAVEEAGLLMPGSRTTLLRNRLVIIAHPDAAYRMDALTDLPGLPFTFLSVGDPAYVPAGRYARDWLEGRSPAEGDGLWARLSDRLAPAADVRAALQQVAARRDVVGVVYQTDATARREAVRILWEQTVDEGPEIRYPAAILRSSSHPEAAAAFLAFLRSPEAVAIFEAHGFLVEPVTAGSPDP